MNIEYIIKIFIYLISILLIYLCATVTIKRTGHAFSWWQLLTFSFLWGGLSLYLACENGLDRIRYSSMYLSGRDVSERQSVGLNWEFELFRNLGLSSDMVFFVSSAFTFFLYLLSFHIIKQSTKESVLLFMMTVAPMWAFAILKQSPSQAFCMLAIMLFFLSTMKEKYYEKLIILLVSFVLIFFGIQFHEAAYIVLPIFLLLLFWNIKIIRYVSYFAIMGLLFVFGSLRYELLGYVGSFSEDLAEQSAEYIESDSENILTVFKNLPFFIISIVGFVRRDYLSPLIFNYDRYLALSVVFSVICLMSIYNYWYVRFSYFLLIPVLVFAGQLKRVSMKRGLSIWWYYLVLFLMFSLMIKLLFQYFIKWGGF